jgi:uncharacterized protein (DUF849 family)
VRIGFENNRLAADGTQATDNEAQIRAVGAALDALSRRPATADELRALAHQPAPDL